MRILRSVRVAGRGAQRRGFVTDSNFEQRIKGEMARLSENVRDTCSRLENGLSFGLGGCLRRRERRGRKEARASVVGRGGGGGGGEVAPRTRREADGPRTNYRSDG